MWLWIDYEAVAAFGLRPSNTTSNGGKSLICPTPYAIKMALLDRAIRFDGIERGRELFEGLQNLKLHVRVPLAVSVNRTFQKVLAKDKDGWKSTISQREYCFHAGDFTLAITSPDETLLVDELPRLFSAINYFGRRGGFMQFAQAYQGDDPSTHQGFVDVCSPPSQTIKLGFLQRMDDMRPDAEFEDVSTFHPRRGDGGRIYHNVIFPYQLAHHGFNHTVYRRTP